MDNEIKTYFDLIEKFESMDEDELRDYLFSLRENPNSCNDNLIELGIIYLLLGYYDTAYKYLKDSYKKDFDSSISYFLSAIALLGDKNIEELDSVIAQKAEGLFMGAILINNNMVYNYFLYHFKNNYYKNKIYMTDSSYKDLEKKVLDYNYTNQEKKIINILLKKEIIK